MKPSNVCQGLATQTLVADVTRPALGQTSALECSKQAACNSLAELVQEDCDQAFLEPFMAAGRNEQMSATAIERVAMRVLQTESSEPQLLAQYLEAGKQERMPQGTLERLTASVLSELEQTDAALLTRFLDAGRTEELPGGMLERVTAGVITRLSPPAMPVWRRLLVEPGPAKLQAARKSTTARSWRKVLGVTAAAASVVAFLSYVTNQQLVPQFPVFVGKNAASASLWRDHVPATATPHFELEMSVASPATEVRSSYAEGAAVQHLNRRLDMSPDRLARHVSDATASASPGVVPLQTEEGTARVAALSSTESASEPAEPRRGRAPRVASWITQERNRSLFPSQDEVTIGQLSLARVRTALQFGDGRRALQLLDARARLWPQSDLEADAMLFRVQALAALERGSEAREIAQKLAFGRGGALAARVDMALKSKKHVGRQGINSPHGPVGMNATGAGSGAGFSGAISIAQCTPSGGVGGGVGGSHGGNLRGGG